MIERWVDKKTYEEVEVLARERTPNGHTLFKHADGTREQMRHPEFAQKYQPSGDADSVR